MNIILGTYCNILSGSVTSGGSLIRSAAAAAAEGDYIIRAGYLLISFYTIDCVRKDVLT